MHDELRLVHKHSPVLVRAPKAYWYAWLRTREAEIDGCTPVRFLSGDCDLRCIGGSDRPRNLVEVPGNCERRCERADIKRSSTQAFLRVDGHRPRRWT